MGIAHAVDSNMQFSLRQLLLGFTAIVVWFSAMAEGNYLLGSYGTVCFGVMFGISILIVLKMIGRWTTWSWAERSASLVALAVSLSAGLYLAYVGFSHEFHRHPQNVRDARRLQSELSADPRFAAVCVTYQGGPFMKAQVLSVRGSVTDEAARQSLERKVESHDQWSVQWDVQIRQAQTRGE